MRIKKVSTAPIPSVDGAVVDSLSGSSTTNAPSIRAVNDTLGVIGDCASITIRRHTRNVSTWNWFDLSSSVDRHIESGSSLEYNNGTIKVKKTGIYYLSGRITISGSGDAACGYSIDGGSTYKNFTYFNAGAAWNAGSGSLIAELQENTIIRFGGMKGETANREILEGTSMEVIRLK